MLVIFICKFYELTGKKIIMPENKRCLFVYLQSPWTCPKTQKAKATNTISCMVILILDLGMESKFKLWCLIIIAGSFKYRLVVEINWYQWWNQLKNCRSVFGSPKYIKSTQEIIVSKIVHFWLIMVKLQPKYVCYLWPFLLCNAINLWLRTLIKHKERYYSVPRGIFLQAAEFSGL